MVCILFAYYMCPRINAHIHHGGVSLRRPAPPSPWPPRVVVVQAPGGGPPPGVAAGGRWIEEKYCGVTTCIIGILLLPCVCFCPLDTRTVSHIFYPILCGRQSAARERGRGRYGGCFMRRVEALNCLKAFAAGTPYRLL